MTGRDAARVINIRGEVYIYDAVSISPIYCVPGANAVVDVMPQKSSLT
jgi:hypothetical protein